MADPPISDFEALQRSLKPALLATTRSTASLCAEDLPFQRSLDPKFARDLEAQNARLLSLAERLLASADSNEGDKAVSGGSFVASRVLAPKLEDAEALDRNWGAVVDVVDSLLERTDGVLDEVRRVMKGGMVESVAVESEKPAATPKAKKAFQQASNILKPQRTFDHPPNNFATGPWKPLLTCKPHAKVPLEVSLRTEQSQDGTSRQMYADTTTFHNTLEQAYNASFYLLNYNSCGNGLVKQLINDVIRYQHPYQTEIEEYRYPQIMYTKSEPIMYEPFETTTATYVDTEAALADMLEDLKQAKEIAIDLEHHDQRTYIGLVCLMQISTRSRDYVIDTLVPWRRRLECLNEVFCDPNILKVLHGSAMDVIWLQRDLGLYLVGVFDTEHACTALNYPKRSLAFLLEKWVGFMAQKQYQLADWRIRPLSKELFEYARSDTHFLLYISDNMRNQLLENTSPPKEAQVDEVDGDLLARVLRESKRYTLQRYENPFYDAEHGLGPVGWYKTLFRTPALLSKQQFSVFKAVHQWRDNLARQADESLPFVMSNHTLQSIAREMPTTPEALLAMIPPRADLLRSNVEKLVMVIVDAKERGVHGMEMRDVMAKSDELADKLHNAKHAARDELREKIKAKIAVAEAKTYVSQQVGKDGVAAVGSPLAVGDTRPAVDVASVKAGGSQFWGNTLANGEQTRSLTSMARTSGVRLVMPMPDLPNGDVFVKEGAAPAVQPPEAENLPEPVATESSTPPPAQDTTFVLREKGAKKNSGKKRKHHDQDGQAPLQPKDELKNGDDEIELGDDAESERKRLKRERKEQRRLEKEAKKTEATRAKANSFLDAIGAAPPKNPANVDDTPKPVNKQKKTKKDSVVASSTAVSSLPKTPTTIPAETEDEQPFDYANAPSVLSGGAVGLSAGGSAKKKKGKKGKMEGFDPYKKALDTGKGLARGQREKVGRGGTFT